MKNGKWKVGLTMMLIPLMCGCSVTGENKTELFDTLSGTEYATRSLGGNDGQGLSDPGNVGVDKETFDSERRYGSEGLTPDVVLNASDYGVSGEDGKDDTMAMIRAIEACRSYGDKLVKLVLPGGDIDFLEEMNPVNNEFGIVFDGLKNLIVAGNGTRIYFHGETAGIIVQDCENIYFEDLSIDWGVPPASTGTILSSDGKTFLVQVHDGYKVDENTIVAAMIEFSKTAYTPRTRGNDIYGNVKKVVYKGDNKLEITFDYTYSVPPVGTLVSIRHYLYEYDCFFVNRCKDIHFESVILYSAPGMGARMYTTENIYMNRFCCVRKPNTDRLMSVNADMIHLIDCFGECLVTNCLFENCGDDAFNGHGAYLVVSTIDSINTISVVNPRGYNFEPRIGDQLEICSNLDLTVIQYVTVKAVSIIKTGGFVITTNEDLLGTVRGGYVVGNATKTPKVLFQNNIVRNKRCRGILVQTRDVTIQNCTFANLADGGILMTADANDWFESIIPSNVKIRNNKFLKDNFGSGNTGGDICITAYGQGYNLATIGSIKDVVIENNFFGNGANSAVYANSVSNMTIKSNLAYNMGLLPKSDIFEAGFYVAYARDVNLVDNAVYLTSSSSYKPVSIGPSTNTDTFQVGNNYGFDESDIKSKSDQVVFNLPMLPSGTTLSMTGTDMSDWAVIPDSMSIKGISDVELTELKEDPSTFKLNALKVCYSDKGIYLAYDVTDDHVQFSSTSSFWEGDGVEIFASANIDSLDPLSVLKLSEDSCLEMFMSGDPTYGNQIVELRTSSSALEKKSMFKMSLAVKDGLTGYVGKAFIPFEAVPSIKAAIDNGEEFSFCLAFMDSDPDRIRVQNGTCLNLIEYNKYVPLKMSKLKVGLEDA